MYSKGDSGCAAFSYRGLFSLTLLSLTYLTQRLEYRFHTARVIGSNPIVGKTGRNPCFCQHDSKHGLAARSQLNDQSIGCFHFFDPLSFSLHVCGLPAPSRIDEQEQKKGARERVEYQLIPPLPKLGEDQGGRKPQRETFHHATRFFREALSQTFLLLPPQAKRFQDIRRPSESEQPRANLLESVPFVSTLSLF